MSSNTDALSPAQVKNWHRSNVVLFVFMGASWAALLTRMPLVKEDLGVTASQLGLILLGTGVGSIIGLNLVGRLIARWGTKRWIMTFYPSLALLVILNTLLIESHSTIPYIVFAFIMGGFMGITDVSVNVDGTALEKAVGKTLMPRMHAGYSVGTLAGSGWGALAAAANFSLLWTTLPLAIVAAVLPFLLSRHLPAGIGVEAAGETHTDGTAKPAHWFAFVLVLFGLGILGITLAEGGAGDWMALGFTQGYHATAANAGFGFTLFFVGMVLVRFYGGAVADRIGKGRALQLFAAIGVAGVLMVIFGAPNLVVGWIGAALWGAGVALGFPLFLSAAGEGENSAKRVGFVATWGYGAFLAGPPLLGLLADQMGMLNMFYVITGFLVVALLVAGAAGNKRA
jgi:MFS family permease